jgi:hypothetical protein
MANGGWYSSISPSRQSEKASVATVIESSVFWFPVLVFGQHSVEDSDEFSHAGYVGGHFGFAGGEETLIERPDGWIVTDRTERG